MSYDLFVYLEKVDDTIIPLMQAELSKNYFECEFHPEFSFDDQSGFLPVKAKIVKSHIPQLNNTDYITGFELYISEYDHHQVLQEIKEYKENTKKSFWDKIFMNKENSDKDEFHEEIQPKLEKAKIELSLNAVLGNFLEISMAWYSAAILVDILDGVLFDPQEGKYFDKSTVLRQAKKIFNDFQEINIKNWRLQAFEEWSCYSK